MPTLPITQFVSQPGILDMGCGHPAPALMPVDAIKNASAACVRRYGSDALTYGASAGPGPLIEFLRQRIEKQEKRVLKSNEILITGGSSSGLDQWLTLYTRAGDTILVESPTYHLAVKLLQDHRLNLIPVPSDTEGLDVLALEAILTKLGKSGLQPRALYTVPTFGNPTGFSLGASRRERLVQLAVENEFVILEDDVYRELAFDGMAPPSLWSFSPSDAVVRLGSFSKSFAPGVRLGWLTAHSKVINRMATGGLLDSGGGINHFMALVMAEVCESGEYDMQIGRLRASYQERRDALHKELVQVLPDRCQASKPNGGFFIWLELPEEMAASELLGNAKKHGVSYLPGDIFHVDGRGANTVRLSFSMLSAEQLEEAARRLGRSIQEAGQFVAPSN
jgi:2-aminoadipate transaminase